MCWDDERYLIEPKCVSLDVLVSGLERDRVETAFVELAANTMYARCLKRNLGQMSAQARLEVAGAG